MDSSVVEKAIERYGVVVILIIIGFLVYRSYAPTYSSGFVGVYLLDKDVTVYTPLRTDLQLSFHNLVDGSEKHIFLHGFTNSLLVTGSSRDTYLIVSTRGFESYVLIISIALVIVYVYGIVRFRKLSRRLLPYTIVTLLALAILSTLYIYTEYTSIPHTTAYIVEPMDLDLKEPSLIDNTTGSAIYLIKEFGRRDLPIAICMVDKSGVDAFLYAFYSKNNTVVSTKRLYTFDSTNRVYCNVIKSMAMDADKLRIVVIMPIGEQAVFQYSHISIKKIREPDPYITLYPSIMLIATLVVIELLYKRFKPRSSPLEHHVEKQHVLVEVDPSSSTT